MNLKLPLDHRKVKALNVQSTSQLTMPPIYILKVSLIHYQDVP